MRSHRPGRQPQGDWWDHVASDPEHKLVRAVLPGAWVTERVEEVIAAVKDRLGNRAPALRTSDAYPAYETVIETAFSEAVPQTLAGPGRQRLPDPRPATRHVPPLV